MLKKNSFCFRNQMFYSTTVVCPSGDVTEIDGNVKTKYSKKIIIIIITKKLRLINTYNF